jgi:hypothetical protein
MEFKMDLRAEADKFALDAGYVGFWVKVKENKVAAKAFNVPAYSVFVRREDSRRGKYIGDVKLV